MVSSFIDQSFYFKEGQWMCAGGEGKFEKSLVSEQFGID
jgi:hypothetical protein